MNRNYSLKMENQLFFIVLILCSIVFQGIWASLEENETLSDTIIRKKRIIDDSEHSVQIQEIRKVPYIVNIHKNGESFCGASILSRIILLTAAYCVHDDHAEYVILSNSIYRNRGQPHRIERKHIYPDYNSTNMSNNLALLIIHPPIDLIHSHNRPIPLYGRMGQVPEFGTLSGWGCSHLAGIHAVYPNTLRSVNLPILNSLMCQNIYQDYDVVSSVEICTFDPAQKKRSCYGDVGGPLVVTGRRLIGVLSWTRVIPNRLSPDVYVNLSLPSIRQWIYGIMAEHR